MRCGWRSTSGCGRGKQGSARRENDVRLDLDVASLSGCLERLRQERGGRRTPSTASQADLRRDEHRHEDRRVKGAALRRSERSRRHDGRLDRSDRNLLLALRLPATFGSAMLCTTIRTSPLLDNQRRLSRPDAALDRALRERAKSSRLYRNLTSVVGHAGRRSWNRPAEAGDGARTHDPQLGKLMLYQLSYARVEAILARVDRATSSGESRPTRGRVLPRTPR